MIVLCRFFFCADFDKTIDSVRVENKIENVEIGIQAEM